MPVRGPRFGVGVPSVHTAAVGPRLQEASRKRTGREEAPWHHGKWSSESIQRKPCDSSSSPVWVQRSHRRRPLRDPAPFLSARLIFREAGVMVHCSTLLLIGASCWLLVVLRCEEVMEERSAADDALKAHEETLLIEALQEVLEKLKGKQLPSSEKKLGWVPLCDAGELCAVRKGARIGKLCGCPAGTHCNFSVLKCL
ncbi:hypothetical protein WMY93_024294 [Mugilogobius chulae]|uniref:Cocaine- and amphetamine-regulated transcript protein n=1 Tax=Mugilogobius chulae TaxID=88201 RepID=A0AAW0NB45_9GOBI